MKLDAHVHTVHSGRSTIRTLSGFVNESYSDPRDVYRVAKARGMDLVAITDHNSIDGALRLAALDDVIVGCEVSAAFPGTAVEAHIGVLDITPQQFREIQIRRSNIARLLPFLRRERIFSILNHPASRVNGKMTMEQITMLLPWVDAVEGINGSRLASQNHTAAKLAHAAGKPVIGGSDAHTLRGIGRSYTVIDGVSTKAEFMAGLHAGLGRAEGQDGTYFTMASDILRCSAAFYRQVGQEAVRTPVDWQRVGVAIATLGLAPVVPIALVWAAAHFQREDSFSRGIARRLRTSADVRASMPEVL